MPEPTSTPERAPAAPQLHASLKSLHSGVRALSSELRRSLRDSAARGGVLVHAALLDQSIEDLIDLAQEPEPRAELCLPEEILSAVRLALAPRERAQLMCARLGRSLPLRLDGALLARCLQRLVRGALLGGSDGVLLCSNLEEGAHVFSVLECGPRLPRALGEIQPATRGSAALDLQLSLPLVRRDLELIGGTLRLVLGARGIARTSVHVPLASTSLQRGAA